MNRLFYAVVLFMVISIVSGCAAQSVPVEVVSALSVTPAPEITVLSEAEITRPGAATDNDFNNCDGGTTTIELGRDITERVEISVGGQASLGADFPAVVAAISAHFNVVIGQEIRTSANITRTFDQRYIYRYTVAIDEIWKEGIYRITRQNNVEEHQYAVKVRFNLSVPSTRTLPCPTDTPAGFIASPVPATNTPMPSMTPFPSTTPDVILTRAASTALALLATQDSERAETRVAAIVQSTLTAAASTQKAETTPTENPELRLTHIVQTVLARTPTGFASPTLTPSPVSNLINLSPTPRPYVVYVNAENANVRDAPNRSARVVYRPAYAEQLTVLGEEQGEGVPYFGGISYRWFRVITANSIFGYIHISVITTSLSAAVPSNQPTRSQSATPGSQTTTGTCTSGVMSGTAADLANAAGGIRSQTITLNAGTAITGELQITDATAPEWGVGFVLMHRGADVAAAEVFHHSQNIRSFTYTVQTSGNYTLQVRLDASRPLRFRASWSCR